jgi:hypothetical protein
LQYLLDAAQDQFFGGAAFAGGATFQPTVNGVRYVHGCSHIDIVPYLWLHKNKNPNGLVEQPESRSGALASEYDKLRRRARISSQASVRAETAKQGVQKE